MKFFAILLIAFLPFNAHADELFEWSGVALGADANIKFYAKNHKQAEKVFAKTFTEIERLENIFSLYIPTSEISRLNKNGYLKNPSVELVFLTHYAKNLGRKTGGVFDPSVQILWEGGDDLSLINYKNIIVDSRIIYFRKKGMKVTLNGVAQGYITDKIVELLQRNNVQSALVDLGEKFAFGTHANGAKWKVAAGDKVYELQNQGMATSSNSGGNYVVGAHIVDAKTGLPVTAKTVTIIANSALEADALAKVEMLLEQ